MAQNNHPQRYQRKQSVDEISMIEDVLRLYNTVAEPFMDVKNALTQQTKSEMLQRIRKIQPSISYIVNGLARILGNYYRDRNTPARRDEIRGFYVKILEAYVCYSLILEQLTSGGIHPINRIELSNRIDKEITENAQVKDVFRIHGLSNTFYANGAPFFGAPPPGGGPPPGAPGAPPGAPGAPPP